jgi:hypothetical protein
MAALAMGHRAEAASGTLFQCRRATSDLQQQ